MFSFICGWKNVHSCTLTGRKIGDDCDDDDQKALFKKGASVKILGIATKHCIGAHQDEVHPGHRRSSVAPKVLMFVLWKMHIFAPCVGWAPKRENCRIMIR